jgi:16S rRNA (adenine1518-N6/adenine1519-N6)-dimethyltransferase
VKAKKSLGQNFLVDDNMAEKMVHCIDPRPDDVMLEIGPGHGVITRLLQPRVRRFFAVEIDQRLYDEIDATFQGCANFTLIKQNFLEFDMSACGESGIRVVGNIPYNITSPILFRMFEQRRYVRDVTLLMQKEVGLRAVSAPNSKDFGILAVISQALADVQVLLKVPPTVFQPRPKVDSVLVRWTFAEARAQHIHDEEFFRSLVRQAFGQRRKMLRNSLKEFADKTSFDFTRRPEQLSVDEWITLANELNNVG